MSFDHHTRSGLAGLFVGVFALVIVLSGYSLTLGPPSDKQTDATTNVAATNHPANLIDGEEIYQTRCMSCHQMNGAGVPGVFPPLTGTEWVTGDKGRLIRVILNGVTGPIEVNGDTYGGAMPPWGAFLDDEEMSQLVTFIRTSWDNDSEEITPEEVHKVREAVTDRKSPWTAADFEDPSNLGIPGEEAE
ncbi:MAG: cytochrome c [Rhodothermales bacterium]